MSDERAMIDSEAVTAGAIRQSLASGEAIADATQIRELVRERNELARQLAETRRIQPNDRYCPQCGTDTLRHAPDGTEYYGAHTQETCLEIRLARAQERANALQCDYDELLSEFDAQNHKLGQVIVELQCDYDELLSEFDAQNHKLGQVIVEKTEMRAAWDEMRDAVLNERGALAEMGLTSDQVNAVLDVIDDAWPDLSDAPANPLAHFTDGQLYDELRRRGWVAATWARKDDSKSKP